MSDGRRLTEALQDMIDWVLEFADREDKATFSMICISPRMKSAQAALAASARRVPKAYMHLYREIGGGDARYEQPALTAEPDPGTGYEWYGSYPLFSNGGDE